MNKNIEGEQFFQEVEEELKYKRAYELWNSYGKYLILTFGVVLAGSIAHLLWSNYSKDNMEKLTNHYMEALRSIENGDYEGSLQQLNDLEFKGNEGFRTLVRLQKAYALDLMYDKAIVKEDELKEKIYHAYESIQKDPGTPKFYKDITAIVTAHGPFPEKHKPEVMEHLEALSISNAGWHYLALEALMIQHGKDNNLVEMRKIATRLKDDMQAPQGIIVRAKAVLEKLDADAIKPHEEQGKKKVK